MGFINKPKLPGLRKVVKSGLEACLAIRGATPSDIRASAARIQQPRSGHEIALKQHSIAHSASIVNNAEVPLFPSNFTRRSTREAPKIIQNDENRPPFLSSRKYSQTSRSANSLYAHSASFHLTVRLPLLSARSHQSSRQRRKSLPSCGAVHSPMSPRSNGSES